MTKKKNLSKLISNLNLDRKTLIELQCYIFLLNMIVLTIWSKELQVCHGDLYKKLVIIFRSCSSNKVHDIMTKAGEVQAGSVQCI